MLTAKTNEQITNLLKNFNTTHDFHMRHGFLTCDTDWSCFLTGEEISQLSELSKEEQYFLATGLVELAELNMEECLCECTVESAWESIQSGLHHNTI